MKKLFILPVLLLAFVAGNVQFASAQSGACLAFKAGDYVTLDTSLGNFGTQNFSIETSFKVANTSNMTLITKRPVCSHSNFWSLSIVSGKLVFEVDENAAGLNYYNLYSASTIVPGNWYHVAVTRTGLTLRIYVNGVEEGFVTQTTITNLINTADLKIGQGPCSSFVGQIDETRIWSRALTACEINSFRSCEIATSFNGLLGNYHYNQGVAAGSNPTMNYLLDVSGTTHNGSLINFTLSGTNSNWVGNGSVVSGQSCIASTNNVPRAYITNQNNPNVLVYDLNTNTEIAKVNIGNGGYGVACTPNGKSVYVANVATGKICEIDAFTHTVTAQISVGLNPFGVCMKPDGTRVYAINSGSNSVSVINTTNNSVVTTIPVTGSPYYGACSPNGQLLYVGSSNLNAVLVINTNTNTIVSTISVGTAPRGIAVSPDGTKIYVCNSTSHTVSVIQASTNTVVATIPVGTTPVGVSVSPLSDMVLVSNIGSGTVSRINANTNIVTNTYTVGTTPRGISFSQDGKKAYVSNAGSNNVSAIDLLNNTVSTLPNVVSAANNSSIGQFVRYGSVVQPVTACGQYVYGGNTLTSSGLYSANFTSLYGCDSTQTIDLQLTPNTLPTPNINVSSTDVCAGGSTVMNLASSYCIPTLAYPGNTNDYIASFNFNYQYVNNSGDGDYTLYPFSINAIAGSNYSVYLNAGGYPQRFALFIDYNQDGDFIDGNEFVWSSSVTSTMASGSFTIPTNARNGNTRLRVMSSTGNAPNASNSCSYNGLGEYEDYPITISGGMPNDTYSWLPTTFLNASNQASVTASGMSASTTYTVTVTDNNGCSKTATKTINVNPIPSTMIMASNIGVCTGASTQLQAVTNSSCNPSLGIPGNTNDYISNFNFDNQIVNPTGDGDYTFYPITANVVAGNSYTFNVTAGGFIQRFAMFIDYNLDGDFIDANEFVWSTLNYASAGNGVVTIPTTASNGLTRMRILSCYGSLPSSTNSCYFPIYGEYEEYYLNITGASTGNSYSWSPATFLNSTNQSEVTASGMTANTTYTVTVTNSFGCTATSSQSILSIPAPPVSIQSSNNTLCSGTSVQLKTQTGNYCTPTIGSSGNTDDYIAYFDFANQIVNSSGDGDYTSYPLTANVTAGNSYTFNLNAGSYTQLFAMYIDYNGDQDFTDANEFVWSTVSYSYTGSGTVIIPTNAINGTTRMRLLCAYGSQPNSSNSCSFLVYGEYEDYLLNISGGAGANTYSWSPANFLNNPNQANVVASGMNSNTTFTVTVTDAYGCTNTATKNITVFAQPVLSAHATDTSICNGASTQLEANASYCTPSLGMPGNTTDYINSFNFDNQIMNTSGDGDYTYYPMTANVTAGSAYNFSMAAGGYSQYFALYIDYNQDGDFEDSNEFVWNSPNFVYYANGSITVPANALNGFTRMRVLCCYSPMPNAQNACAINNYGEYEDYRLQITGGLNGDSYSWSPGTFLNSTNQRFVTASNVTANTAYTVTATSANGCTATSTVNIMVTPCTANNLQIKCFIEGYYLGSGLMQPVKMNQGISLSSTAVDDITIEIKQSTSPYTTLVTSIGELQTNGNVQFSFNPIPTGIYYVVLKHRNSVETWSASPIPILTSSTYDFSSGADRAFGSNLKQVSNGVWALYSGDINQDGAVDALDYVLLDPDVIAGSSGYLNTDITGDGYVDAFDYLVLDANLISGVGAVTP